jgi:hypothetical protein
MPIWWEPKNSRERLAVAVSAFWLAIKLALAAPEATPIPATAAVAAVLARKPLRETI